MKLSSANIDPMAVIRRRMPLRQAAPKDSAARVLDAAESLGVPEPELTPAVQEGLGRLIGEIDDLKAEVSRLRALLTETEGLADKDVLTPLLNRRAFMRELARAAAFTQRYGTPVSLIYFDLDGFKAVNDRFGHAAGDEALKAVAERLLTQVRESDLVGRLGGDEFAVILTQADGATARVKADALRKALESQPIQFGEWMTPLHLTVGVRQIAPGETAEQALAAADKAMYEAKRRKG